MGVKWGAGKLERRATLKEVAAALGVSPATVSNAYNRPDQLSPLLREKVFEAAGKLGYSGPDPVARSLRRRKAGAVGVLYSDRLSYAFADPAAVEFFEGISVATEEAGLGMLLLPGSARGARDPEAVGNAVVDGFVIYCMADDDPLVDAALGRRVPVVLVDHPGVGDVPYVGIDDEGAAAAAAEHLISLGHRRLGVVSFELTREPAGGLADLSRPERATFGPSRARLRGYATALRRAGLPVSEVPVFECAESTTEEGRAAAQVLLGTENRPTALLCMSDQLAFGVLDAARDLGLSVPGDLSVVGFDDVSEAARTHPPLTTIHQPHVEKGLLAGRILVARLGEEEPPEARLLPTRLVERGSTAPPGQAGG
jgi:DNA-binding LacI/PurR family transcriptional regulator